jgi:hypothetical protein
MLVAWSFHAEGRFVGSIDLRLHGGIFERHLGNLLRSVRLQETMVGISA